MSARQLVPLRFLLALALWTVAGNALLASAYVESAVVVPFSRWQGELAQRFVVGGPLSIEVIPDCSGLDVMSLCLAAILSYPATWRRRLPGAAVGVGLLFVLNVLRISVLAVASHSTAFNTLHLYIWPAILVVVTLTWIAVWIRSADNVAVFSPGGRFVLWSAALLAVYVVAVQQLSETPLLNLAAGGVAQLAAGVLRAIGTEATVAGNMLQTRHLQYLITPECITTPLVALYLAALFASPISWRARLTGIACCLPLFVTLGVVRLLTVALPPLILGTELVLTHAFHQIITGIALVIAGALWARGERSRRRAAAVALIAIAMIAVAASLVGGIYARALMAALHTLHLPVAPGLTPIRAAGDVQAATIVMPVFQLALYASLAIVAWPLAARWRWATGAGVLLVSQLVILAALGWSDAAQLPQAPALFVRGWAVAIPVLVVLAVCHLADRNRTAPAGCVTA